MEEPLRALQNGSAGPNVLTNLEAVPGQDFRNFDVLAEHSGELRRHGVRHPDFFVGPSLLP